MTIYVLLERQGKLSVEMVTPEQAEALRGPCGTCGDKKTIPCGICVGRDSINRTGGYYYQSICPDVVPCPDCVTVHSERTTKTEAEIDKLELERRRK